MHNRYKMCPAYILPHWATFKATVKRYLDQMKGASSTSTSKPSALRYNWKKGQAVRLYKTKTQLFSSDTATKAATTLPAGVYYIYDGKQCKLGRFRITTRKEYCGKTPAGKYVTGYVSVDNFREI